MKATGIIRKIDDLGRIVIPKELRRTLRIREGDPLEIYTEKDGEVIFKKYSPMGDLADLAGRVCEAVQKNTGCTAAVCDRDAIIAAAGPGRQKLLDRRLSRMLVRLLDERESYRYPGRGPGLPVIEENGRSAAGTKDPGKQSDRSGMRTALPETQAEVPMPLGAAAPIVAEGDLLGGVLLLAEPEKGRCPGEFDLKLIQTVAAFLGRQMEA